MKIRSILLALVLSACSAPDLVTTDGGITAAARGKSPGSITTCSDHTEWRPWLEPDHVCLYRWCCTYTPILSYTCGWEMVPGTSCVRVVRGGS